MVGFRDAAKDGYVPSCGDCAKINMGFYLEVVDALAIWPPKKGTDHA